MSNNAELLHRALRERIVIIDGAMGTTIRTYGLGEAEIRGERFKDSKKDLKNNGDLYSLTQPGTIGDIHRRFLESVPQRPGMGNQRTVRAPVSRMGRSHCQQNGPSAFRGRGHRTVDSVALQLAGRG